MAAKIGTGDILFRVGSGSPSKAFLGSTAVQTVPGKPTINDATVDELIVFVTPADGGSPILGYNIYNNGSLLVSNATTEGDPGEIAMPPSVEAGDEIEIAAVNAIGEGPKSDPETAIA
jgi:hypothetical protein